MIAMEMVSDRATKAPVAGDVALKLQDLVYENGVMVRVSGPNLILSPPLVLSEADVAAILAAAILAACDAPVTSGDAQDKVSIRQTQISLKAHA